MYTAAALMFALPQPGSAQETREGTITQAQAEKASNLRPYAPNQAERLLTRVQQALAAPPEGFFPYSGSIYSGGGFTLGAGYRRYLGDRSIWSLTGLYSIKNYKLFELSLFTPRSPAGRVEYRLFSGFRDAPQVAFYGLGIDSQDRTSFHMEQGFGGGELGFWPVKWQVLRGGARYESFTLGDGAGGEPDTDDVFTPATAPGLGDSPDFFHTNVSAAIDTRNAPGYSRRGGLYQLGYHQYTDVDDVYTFDRLDAEIVQHVPVLREAWVLSFRGRLQSIVGDDDLVPYFLMPSLGSGSSLRGYRSWRFRDRNSLLLSAEWRWIPSRMAMDAAIFFDAGSVADRVDALTLGHMKTDVGIGVRFHSLTTTPLRIELAKGSEGFHLIFAASAAF